MDSDTDAESDFSLKSRLRKMVNRSPEDAMQDIDKTFYDLVNVYVFDIGMICIHEKDLLGKCTFHQKTGERSHFETDVRDI